MFKRKGVERMINKTKVVHFRVPVFVFNHIKEVCKDKQIKQSDLLRENCLKSLGIKYIPEKYEILREKK